MNKRRRQNVNNYAVALRERVLYDITAYVFTEVPTSRTPPYTIVHASQKYVRYTHYVCRRHFERRLLYSKTSKETRMCTGTSVPSIRVENNKARDGGQYCERGFFRLCTLFLAFELPKSLFIISSITI